MSQTVHKIKTIETNSELEALLLESKMVKENLPLHNRQLRRRRELVIISKSTDNLGYIKLETNSVKELEPHQLSSVYGVYTNRAKAKNALEIKCRTFSLCPKLLGLEKATRNCFLSQLGKCAGACAGLEKPATYNRRLELAMERSKIDTWPYEGPVRIDENKDSSIIVDRWVIVKRIYNKTKVQKLPLVFDLDNYKILRSYFISNPDLIKSDIAIS